MDPRAIRADGAGLSDMATGAVQGVLRRQAEFDSAETVVPALSRCAGVCRMVRDLAPGLHPARLRRCLRTAAFGCAHAGNRICDLAADLRSDRAGLHRRADHPDHRRPAIPDAARAAPERRQRRWKSSAADCPTPAGTPNDPAYARAHSQAECRAPLPFHLRPAGNSSSWGKLLECGCRAACAPRAASPRARFGPPTVLGGTDDQFSVGIVGGVGAFLHQAEDVVGMEVRDQHGADLGGIDPAPFRLSGRLTAVGCH